MIHAGQVIVKILPNSRFKASMLATRRNDHQTNSLHKHQQMYTSLHREFVFLHRYYAIWVKQPLSTCPSPSSWIRLSAQVARNWPRVQEAWKLDNNGDLFLENTHKKKQTEKQRQKQATFLMMLLFIGDKWHKPRHLIKLPYVYCTPKLLESTTISTF